MYDPCNLAYLIVSQLWDAFVVVWHYPLAAASLKVKNF